MSADRAQQDEIPDWALAEKPPEEQEAVLQEIVRRIVEVLDPERIILFGSFARGTATRHSDVDLAIIKETDVPPGQRTRDLRLALFGAPCAMDLLVFTPSEHDHFRHIRGSINYEVARTGRVLYERQPATRATAGVADIRRG